jgi:adenylosuccinate synthase
MSVTAIVGAQWGDEGKGKLVHLLSQHQDYVLRYQGGSNAGHTVKVNGEVFKFKLMPSGILHPGVRCLLGDGVVVNPLTLCEEIAELSSRGALRGQLIVSGHAHLVLPYHAVQDAYFEEAKGKDALGTTRRGIGPAYADKHFRVGVRAGDMLRPGFAGRVKASAARKNVLFSGYYGRPAVDPDAVWAEVAPTVEIIAPLVADTIQLMRQALKDGARIMCEGAQGTLLDIDYGTYPYVTSSHPVVGGALLGTGLSWRDIGRVIGVSKAYTTRVGAGPFPTEELGEAGSRMREAGAEYGTVTGRPRRCGWLDLPLLNYATQLNGFTELALTKTDVLDGFAEIKVCVAYERRGTRIAWPDLDPGVLEECTPVYATLPGWHRPTDGLRREADLPLQLMKYTRFIEEYVATPVRTISVGPDWEATITRG